NQLFGAASVRKVPHIAARKLAPVWRSESNKPHSQQVFATPFHCEGGTDLAPRVLAHGAAQLT
ncbi:MAG TPA: hypothetical protein VFZ71_01460, partial [Pyrinomonadaceae bacterium]